MKRTIVVRPTSLTTNAKLVEFGDKVKVPTIQPDKKACTVNITGLKK
jgi:hypothetical protein